MRQQSDSNRHRGWLCDVVCGGVLVLPKNGVRVAVCAGSDTAVGGVGSIGILCVEDIDVYVSECESDIKDELNKLKDENAKLKKENADLKNSKNVN